jgi:hypothetical protein
MEDDRRFRAWPAEPKGSDVICPDPYCRVCKDEDGEIRYGWDDQPYGDRHP